MAINLPNSPSNGQTVTLADKTLVYNSTSGTWNIQTTDSSGGSLSISDTAPSSPSDGDMWFDSSTLTLYAYYDDGDSQQWIDLAGQATTLQATSSDTAPANPSTGALWFDTANLNLFVYYSDGSSNQWVQMNSEAPAIPEDLSDLTDTTNLLFDGQYSSLTGAPTSSTAGALGTLTKTFTQNEEAEITLSETISPVPNVSVFKEVPQGGLTSKGNWDVNANATNYEFFDEKPLNYNTITLTPSATGDGTFTSSNPTLVGYDVSGISSVGNYETANAVAQVPSPPPNAYTLADFVISPDGTKIIIVSAQRMHEFTMSTAYDITSASWTQRYDYDAYNPSTWGGYGFLELGDSGSKLYMADWQNNKIDQFTLSVPYSFGNGGSDVSFSGQVTGMNNSGSNQTQNGMYVKDSTTVFIMKDDVTGNQAIIEEWVMSTAWDITTLSYNNKTKSITGQRGTDMTFSSDGLTMFISDVFGSGTLKYFSLGTAWDISTINTTGTTFTNPAATNSTPQAINFSNSGTKLYMADGTKIYEQDTGYSEVFSSTDVGKVVTGNSGSAIITATSGTYTSVTAFADTSVISSWQLFGAQGKADGSGIELSGYSAQSDIVFPTGASGSGASMVYNNNVSPTDSALSSLKNIVLNSAGTIALTLVSSQVQRWNLSTAFDLSSMTEDAPNNNTTQMTTNMTGLAVKPDGTRFWVSDYNQDLIKQFTMSTAWSPSTANYDGYYMLNNGGAWNNFSGGGSIPSTTNFNPFDFQFNSDGTKMITIMWDNNPYHSVVEFTLSTAWDMSTMSYTSYANLVGNSDPEAITISADGLKLMMHGSGLGDGGIEVYSLPSAFSVGTAGSNLTRTSGAMDLSSLTGNSSNNITNGGLSMSSDGKRMWVIYNNNSGSNPIYEITGGTTSVHPYSTYSPALTTTGGQINSSSWIDLDSMVADETKNGGDVFYAVSTDDRTSWGVIKDGDGVRKIARNNSGTWQYNNDAGTSTVIGYDLSSSATLNKTLSYNSQEAAGGGMAFNNDGTKLYLIGEQNNLIHEYTLSTAYDISTSSYNSVTFDPSILSAIDIKWKPDGTKVYIMDYDSSVRGTIYTFNVSTAWDITTASSASETFRGNAQDSSLVKFAFKTDGTRLYKLGRQGNRIHAYDLSTAWDVSSASYASEELPMGNVVANSTVGTSMNGLAFNSSGTKVFVAVYHSTNTSNNRIYEIDLSTAWDIGIDNNGNGNYAGVYLNTDRVVNVLFNGDGSQVYAMNAVTDTISSYSSGTASIVYGTSETWVNGTNNNEHATLQEALGAQSFNRMDKAQLQAVTDPNHYVLGDTLDLMIAPYAASGTSPLSDGVTIGYQADALIKQAINGTDYEAEFPATNKVKIKSLAAQNLKIRII